MNDEEKNGQTNGEEKEKRYKKCFYYVMGDMEQIKQGHVHFCAPEEAETLHERTAMKKEIDPEICETCERFKNIFIEYPLTINGIETEDLRPRNVSLKPVRIRPCKEDKTYFGIYLGEFPCFTQAELNMKTEILRVSVFRNPCIFVPELGRVVFGNESWWSKIEPGEDIKDITDETIRDQWYMKWLTEIAQGKEEQESDNK